jgi:shikimate kinase
MIISLIGMSGSGKTYWSKKLERVGFKRYSVDDLIEEKLEKELSKLDYLGINGVAKWMGQPFEPQYKKASQTYLALEEKAIETVFALINGTKKTSQNIVVDTTGSLIYLRQDILLELAKLTKTIYFKIPKEVEKHMYELFLKNPKPVIWGNMFMRQEGEDNRHALCRCYPKLLKYRASQYQKLAHLILDYSLLKSSSFTARKFITKINLKNFQTQEQPLSGLPLQEPKNN